MGTPSMSIYQEQHEGPMEQIIEELVVEKLELKKQVIGMAVPMILKLNNDTYSTGEEPDYQTQQ